MDLKTHNQQTLELLEWAELTTRIKLVGIIMGVGVVVGIALKVL